MDIRTYLTLERTLLSRLLDDWKEQSADRYEAIAEACKARQWDRARTLASGLDLAPVGEQNREWIKYMLLSFAMYGAARAAYNAPMIRGLGSFDETLDRVTQLFMLYLENSGTTQIQMQALQLIADDEFEHKVQKGEHKYGIVMVTIHPDSDMAKALDAARASIPDEDLAGNGKDVGENHVTIRYGIRGKIPAIREWLSTQHPFLMVMGKTKVFTPSDHSEGAAPVVIEILCPYLGELREGVEKVGNCAPSNFADFTPHATLAFVKPELAEKYELLDVQGQQYWCPYVTISSPDGTTEDVWLTGVEQEGQIRISPGHYGYELGGEHWSHWEARKADISTTDLGSAGLSSPQLGWGKRRKRRAKQKFIRVAMKADPYHDAEGKFASKDHDVSVRESGNWVYFSTADNKGKLEASVKEGKLQVREANVEESSRGKGLGVALYEKALNYAHAHGMDLRSDAATSVSADYVWQALKRRGHDVKRNQTELDDSLGKYYSVKDTYIAGQKFTIRTGEPVWIAKIPAKKADPYHDAEGKFSSKDKDWKQYGKLYSETYNDNHHIVEESRKIITEQAKGSGPYFEAAQALVQGVREAPATSEPLFRAVTFSQPSSTALEGKLKNAKEGDTVSFDRLSSFTEREGVASTYATAKNPLLLNANAYLIVVKGEHKSLAMDQVSGLDQGEHVTNGMFKVVSVETGKQFAEKEVAGETFKLKWDKIVTLQQVEVF